MEKVVQICANCQRENLRDAAVCVYCGVSLSSSTTVIVPDYPAGMSRPDFLSQLLGLHSDALILLVMGQDQPIVIKGAAEVSLGRNAPDEPPLTVDLTRYDALALGVSRRHALIVFHHAGSTIQDLGSSNGTFLNEKRLEPHQPQPLKNGDLVRLGQLMIFAFFSAQRGIATRMLSSLDEQTIWLRDRDADPDILPGSPITPGYLAEEVLPYLSAMADVQHILNPASGENSGAALGIISIGRAKAGTEIVVSLVGASAVVAALQKSLTAWIPDRSESQTQNRERGAENVQRQTPVQPREDLQIRIQRDLAMLMKPVPLLSAGAAYRQPAGVSLHQLAAQILSEHKPGLSPAELTSLAEKLLPPLNTLTNLSLYIVSPQEDEFGAARSH